MPKRRSFSDEQLGAYRRDGVLTVRGLFGAQAMSKIATWVGEVQAYPETPGEHMMYFEESLLRRSERVLSRVENFTPYHRGLRALIDGDDLLGRVSELFGEPAVLFKEKINLKPPGGGGFEAHQDMQAGWGDYASLFITALVSVDAATPDNGCLEIAAGCHTRGLIGKEWRPLADDEFDSAAFAPYPTEPGDAVFFDSFAPHRSGPNLTRAARRVLYLTYNRLADGDHRLRYYADKRRSYPPDCERKPGKTYVFRV